MTDLRLTDKAKVRDTIFKLRDEGMSYREIAKVIGLHFTRIQQIVKAAQDHGNNSRYSQ